MNSSFTFVLKSFSAIRLACPTLLLAALGALFALHPCFAADGRKGPESGPRGELRPWLAGERRFPDRISHLHDPALKKIAEDARSSFNTAIDDQNGFDAELLKRLASKTKISESLLDLRSKILEEDFATGIGTNTWASFGSNYYANVGLASSNLTESIYLHDIRLASRLSLLSSAAHAYRALVLGMKILATESKGALTNVSRNLSNVLLASPDAVPKSDETERGSDGANALGTSPESRFGSSGETVLAFLRAFEQAGRIARSNILGAQSMSFQSNDLYEQAKAIYREIDQSSDGVALSLVVPIVGAGLDEASISILTNHVTELRSRVLSAFAERFCSGKGKHRDSADLKEFRDACYQVIRPILDSSIEDDCEAAMAALGRREGATFGIMSRASEPPARIFADPEVLEFRFLNGKLTSEGYRAGSAAVPAPANVPAELKSLGIEQTPLMIASLPQATDTVSFVAKNISFPRASAIATTELPALIEGIDDVAGKLDNLAVELSTDLKDALSAGAKVLASLGTTNEQSVAHAITNILFNAPFWTVLGTNLMASPLIDTNEIGTNFQFIVEGVGEIVAEARAEQARLLSVVLEFAANRTRLQQENLRHLQALGAVVSKELRRWNGLYAIHKRYRDAFGAGPNLGLGPIPKSDPVLLSMRLLAKEARARHWEERPYDAPPQDGMGLLAAHRQLSAAVGLIQGYFLMDVFNRRYGGENSLLLDREIEEHALHLASIRNKITQSMIRLAVEDQLAFHSTGWTKEDFANIMRALQSLGLGWLAEGN
jgi:hypothetical protein